MISMKLSSIKLSVFTDLVTVCLHARTDTRTHSQTHTHAQANMQSHMRIMYVLLRKLVCVSFMNIIVPQIGTTVTQLWQDGTRRGTRHKARQSEASCGACSTQRILFQFGCETTSNVRPEKRQSCNTSVSCD